MRKLQRICASLSLALALSIPALADGGNIQTGATGTPPPPPQPAVFETTEDVNDATLADPLAELALALLNGVLSIF